MIQLYDGRENNRNRDRYRNRIGMVLGSEKLDVLRHAREQWLLAPFVEAWLCRAGRILRLTESIPISIAISIPMKQAPNKTLHSTRTSRASELYDMDQYSEVIGTIGAAIEVFSPSSPL